MNNRKSLIVSFVTASAIVIAVGAASASRPVSNGSAARDFARVLEDPSRPPADVARDGNRKPADLLAFAGVHKGMRVAELAPGGGYFTRILAGAVGNRGHVYAVAVHPSAALIALAQQRANLTIVTASPGMIPVPAQVDLVWTTLNYHDFKNSKLETGSDAAVAYDSEAFRVLRPGGSYLVVDHESASGAGASQTATLHRIEDGVVRKEVLAAGFTLDGESDLLRNAADDHATKVVDAAIRGKTDQFVLRFRKPG